MNVPVDVEMKISGRNREILRQLASAMAEIASLGIQNERKKLWARLNDLEPVRPLVWINPSEGQLPWHELGIENELLCDQSYSRELELPLRKKLYQWRHFPGDMIIDDIFYCPLVMQMESFGLETQEKQICHDGCGAIASRRYRRQIHSEEDIEKIRTPRVRYDAEKTENNFYTISELFEGILPVVKRGQPGIWFAPWDVMTMWYGAEEILLDMAMRPEFLKRAIEKLVTAWRGVLEQYETQGWLALNNENWCSGAGTGGPAYTGQLPQEDFDPGHVRTCDLWGSAAAQIFSAVSPDMHRELALTYEIPWLEKFGLNYYGCCDPLHLKVDNLRAIPRLRKISMSPWADIEKGAQAIQDQYVFSWKPNPALFVTEQWDEKHIAAELRQKIKTIKHYGCPLEIILSDVSTVRNEPRRLSSWAQLATKIAEEFQV